MRSIATASHRRGAVFAALALVAVAGSVTACGSTAATAGRGGGSAAGTGTYTVWDPYPQFGNSSAWARMLDKWGTSSGVAVKGAAFDATELTSKVLRAAQQGAASDVLIVDNPVVSPLASGG